MTEYAKRAYLFGAVLMFFAVALGAFGAHALTDILQGNGYLAVYQTASEYHFYHGLGLLFIGAYFDHRSNSSYARSIINLLVIGTAVFSGSLYLLATCNLPWLGAVTPFGGLCLLAAWGLFALSIFKSS